MLAYFSSWYLKNTEKNWLFIKKFHCLCPEVGCARVSRLKAWNLSKKRLWRRCFPESFAKFLRTPFLQDTTFQLYLSFAKLLFQNVCLTISWRRPLSYGNQSIDLLCKSMNWFLYDNGLRHKRVNSCGFASYWPNIMLLNSKNSK